ncbi:hypothetical protein P879_02711 [Paragonimus westermani]|uniref:UPF0506 domain-containing protein n=1 Tax=Paragonimus westermani TaxID=34504 RepID=A0A8T0DHX1_9TREM|nr:hypothetical protein P879_02711 [Paragonimus westermani]
MRKGSGNIKTAYILLAVILLHVQNALANTVINTIDMHVIQCEWLPSNFLMFISISATAKCVILGGACDGTPLHRCCGDLNCELRGLFAGVCKTCIHPGAPCARDAQCCSGRCKQLNCMEF